jgi:hypothetical protein
MSGQELEAPIESLETCSDQVQPELEARVAEHLWAKIAKPVDRPSRELSVRVAPGDPLTGLLKSDPSLCQQVEAFVNVLGASVDMVVPRGVPDRRMADGMSWPKWERRRLEQVVRTGRITMAEARAREEKERAENSTWREHWRKVARGWAKWMRWYAVSPRDAEKFRREHEDGQVYWLLELAARRIPMRCSASKKGKT